MSGSAVAVAALVAVSALVSCADERVSSAAPPTVVCGQTVSRSPAGPVITDATAPVTVRYRTAGDDIYLRVSRRCDHGARVSYPSGTATRAAAASTRDKRLAMIVLKPLRSNFDVEITPPSGPDYLVEVRLGS